MRFEELLRKSERKGREEGREEGRAEGHAEGLEEGMEKGMAKGQNQLLRLIDCMTQAGESAELPRLTTDPEYLKAMLEKYHL